MSSFNNVTLVGNLTRDVEVRYVSGDVPVATIGLAVNESYKRADGTKAEDVLFIDITAWRRTAEVCAEYLTKGSQVLFSGRLKLDQWEDRESGAKRSKITMVADKMVMLGSKQETRQSHDTDDTKPIEPPQDSGFYDATASDDDVPF